METESGKSVNFTAETDVINKQPLLSQLSVLPAPEATTEEDIKKAKWETVLRPSTCRAKELPSRLQL